MKAAVNITGRLTRDITNTFSNPDGTANRCLFTVACNSYYKGSDGSKKESVDFIPCIGWGGLVPILTKWGLKGRLIHAEGVLEAFQAGPDENGKYPATKVQVRVEKFEFLDKKPEGVKDSAPAPAPGVNTGQNVDMGKLAEMVAQKLLGATNTNAEQTGQAEAAEAAAEQQASSGGLDSVT